MTCTDDERSGRSASDFNAQVVEEFRACGGRVGGMLASTPLLLLHHTGRRSGISRVVPLAYLAWSDRRFLITASDGGSPSNPHWYYNLTAAQRAIVEVGTEVFSVTVEEVDQASRAQWWSWIVRRAPTVATFQASTARVIPVLILTREN